MKKSSVALGCRIISLLIFLTLIVTLATNWHALFGLMRILYYLGVSSPVGMLLTAVWLVFILINLTAALGMYWLKNWGFAATYTAIVFSSLFLATSYVPLVSHIFPAKYEYMSLFVINVTVLLCVAYLNVMVRRRGRPRPRKRRTR